jgi:hypothetical protein
LVGTLNIQKIVLTGDMTRFGDEWRNAVSESMQTGAFSRMAEGTNLRSAHWIIAPASSALPHFCCLMIIPFCSTRKINVFAIVPPQVLPPLDEDFRPAILVNQNFQREVESVGVRISDRRGKKRR